MLKVVLRQEAINDLNNIWDYTFKKWSEKQADKYYAAIKLAFNGIGEHPSIGKEYFEVNKNLFGFNVGKHIIFYHLVSNNRIEIIRILHQRMDLKNRLIEH